MSWIAHAVCLEMVRLNGLQQASDITVRLNSMKICEFTLFRTASDPAARRVNAVAHQTSERLGITGTTVAPDSTVTLH
jgi:hypothetical protein